VATTKTAEQPTRRDFLYIATSMVGAVGAAAVAWPLINQMNPDASVLALSSTEVDLAPIVEGQILTVKWRGKPVFISHRTKKEIEEARAVKLSDLPDPQTDEARVKKDKKQWLVVIGI
jgi:ubiquinol-cytochrome c reductase iron-sulfur subunit